MSRNYYSEINLHLVWHTKNSLPLLDGQVGVAAYRALRNRIIETPGAFIHEIGGIATHVHLAVSVPPTLTPSEWIGKLKGGSAHDVNSQFATLAKVLQWQTGYGIVSFGSKDLQWVIAYVQNQEQHHARGSSVDRLEKLDQDERP